MVKFFRKRPYILFILPAFLMYSIFIIYPLAFVVPYSFTSWSGFGPMEFAGLQNFRIIFQNEIVVGQLKNAFGNIMYRLFLNYSITHPIIITFAYLIYRKMFGAGFIKTVVFMPNFADYVAIAFMVSLFFSPSFGLYGTFMKAIGLEKYAIAGIWSKPSLGVPLTVLVACWKTIGYDLLLYIAAFNSVPVEMDESAKIDGAGELRRFFNIYMPLSMPAITNILILQYIHSLLSFDASYMLGSINGGIRGCMDTLMLFFYRNVFDGGYASNFVGMGSAFSMVIVIPVVIGTLLLQFLLKKFKEGVE